MKIKIKKYYKHESFQLLVLLILTALVLYFIPIIKPLFFLLTLYLFYKSEKNYFWLVYFFTLIMDIGGFFQYLTEDVIQLGPAKIDLFFLYGIVSFLKIRHKDTRIPYFLKNILNIWLFYLFFLIYIGMFVYGNSGGGKSGYRYFFTITMMLPGLTTIFTSYKFIPNETILINFSRLIFFTIIINVIGQFLHLFLNEPMYSYFMVKEVVIQGEDYVEKDFTEKLVRPVWGVIHSLIAIFLAIYWSVRKNNQFKNSYLMFFLALSIFSIFITATRGWIIAVIIFIIASLFMMNFESKIRIVKIIFITIFSFLLIYAFYKPVTIQTDLVFERLTSLKDLAKGDVTAGGTNLRLTDRNKPVMELFYKRPIFGSAFSLEGLETSDQHVGNQNALMSGGVIGYIIILIMWAHIVVVAYKANKYNLSKKNYNEETLLIIPLLLSLIVVHSTSTSLFGYIAYEKYPDKLLVLGVIFGIMNQIIYNYKIKGTN